MADQITSILTKSEYARLHGVKSHTVSMWIARGHLTPPALREDGMIDVELADMQLRERLHALKSTGKGSGPQSLFNGTPVAAATAATDTPPVATEAQPPGELNTLRIRRERVLVEDAERKVALARGELMPVTEAEAVWMRELTDLLIGIEQWLPDLVTKLGGGRSQVDLARAEWRAFRERRAAAAKAAREGFAHAA